MKTDIQEMNTEIQEKTSLSAAVLDRIEHERVSQVPRWQFLLTEYGVWILWGLSVLFGAIAFSVMLLYLLHAGFAFREATHDTAFGFFMDMLPYLWITVFILMAILAQHNLRHTKRGYRYPVWQILLCSILTSFMGGAVLHYVGLNYAVDAQAGKSIPMYTALEKMETRIWQQPEQGRLVGFFVKGASTDRAVMFTDVAGVQWILNTLELTHTDMRTLHTQNKVRVLGTASSTAAYFHGCAVFPWIFSNKLSFTELKRDREAFVARMRDYHQQIEQTVLAKGAGYDGGFGTCAKHAAVMRLSPALAQ